MIRAERTMAVDADAALPPPMEGFGRQHASQGELPPPVARPLDPEPPARFTEPPPPIARSEYDVEREAPFNRAINVYGTGVPE